MADAAFLEKLFARLNDTLPADDARWALLKVRASDYEIRTIAGAVGRGATIAGAVSELTRTYGRQRRDMDQASPGPQPWQPKPVRTDTGQTLQLVDDTEP